MELDIELPNSHLKIKHFGRDDHFRVTATGTGKVNFYATPSSTHKCLIEEGKISPADEVFQRYDIGPDDQQKIIFISQMLHNIKTLEKH